MKCANHSDNEAIIVCNHCAKPLCAQCSVDIAGQFYCNSCSALKTGAVKKYEHSPALAAVLSFIISGLGQIYNGQIGKGMLIFLTGWLVIPWIIGIFDAYFTAKKIQAREIAFSKKTGCLIAMVIGVFISLMIIFVLAILAAIAIPNFLQAKNNARESLAKQTLKTISLALEAYAVQNNGVYPVSEASLIPDYLSSGYNKKQIHGYIFSEDLKTTGYLITAAPQECFVTGNKIFYMETKSKFSEEPCQDYNRDYADPPDSD
jgi:TM2 domain-containing membrane protein YozV/type II secretory pathway pseudopilin PulG